MTVSLLPLMAPAGGQGEPNSFALFLPFILIFVIMYFFMIRPQVKKQKQHQAMLQTLTKGDKVVTTGGLHGKIVGIKDHSFLVQVAENTKVEISKSAVAQKLES